MPPTNQTPTPAPTPAPEQPERPTIHPTLPPDTPAIQPTKDKKSFMIALIVSIALLIAAGGVAWWLWQSKTSPPPSANVPQLKTDDTTTVKTVAWQAPPTLPEGFALATTSATGSLYSHADGCDISAATSAQNGVDMQSAADAVEAFKKLAESAGVKVTAQNNLDDTFFADADTMNRYTFKGQAIDQEINLPGVPSVKTHTVMWYKDFNQHIATLTATCKEAAWTTHGAAVEDFLLQFTLKTERS